MVAAPACGGLATAAGADRNKPEWHMLVSFRR